MHAHARPVRARCGKRRTPTNDRTGLDIGQAREHAYDIPLDEGTPLLAMGDGEVLIRGSRERDVSYTASCPGTPNQGEIYVKYKVGPASDYQETFVVYYAHVRNRLVTEYQTVKAGQILGYSGASGCTGGNAHLHMGVFRASNTNARSATDVALGYRMSVWPNNGATGLIANGQSPAYPYR